MQIKFDVLFGYNSILVVTQSIDIFELITNMKNLKDFIKYLLK